MNKNILHSGSTLLFAMGILLSLTISCGDDTAQPKTPIPGSLGSTASAGVDEQVVYIPEGNTLSIEVISIEDSRCPSDATCVWAGVAHVKFSVTGNQDQIDLYIGAGSDPEAASYEFMFGGQSYELILTDVTPYPTTKNFKIRKTAHFTLKRP